MITLQGCNFWMGGLAYDTVVIYRGIVHLLKSRLFQICIHMYQEENNLYVKPEK